ncbi:membrane protein [Opitutaceae bacterium TAV5]|nr:membrane protein [Opitutaceae bacterium TAV5]
MLAAIGLCLSGIPDGACEDAPLAPEALQARLAVNGVLRCDFEQTRTISGMARPLRSSGSLELSSGGDLVWRQARPFGQTVRLSPGRIEITLDGQPPEIITERDNPGLFRFNRLLSALLAADHAALARSFDLAISGTAAHWTLRLDPRDDLLRKIFLRITLTGTGRIETILIEDRQGDVTSLRFLNYQVTPPASPPVP